MNEDDLEVSETAGRKNVSEDLLQSVVSGWIAIQTWTNEYKKLP
jgi:hypothetical protein